LLREDQLDLVWRFGLQSGHDVDKLAGLATEPAGTGSPRLLDVIGWADCRVEARWDSGDRTVYLAEIVESRLERKATPLTVHGLVRSAPRDKLEQLRALREQDSRIDAAAILAWRKEQGGTAGEA
jgi:flavin reductase (DIM6/NTAB) family NADH-FMN oxidoreductase RutF